MATIREIKRRIKTSKNISQVARAQEMVSVVKMRKAQDMAIAGRSYSQELEKMLTILTKETKGQEKSVFLTQPTGIKKILVVVIAPKRGLCGPLIGNMFRQLSSFMTHDKRFSESEVSFVTIGKKSKDIVKSFRKPIPADFEAFSKEPAITDILPISDYIVQEFTKRNFDMVFVAYTEFVNTMSQKPVVRQFLPIMLEPKVEEEKEKEKKLDSVILFEPTPSEVLDGLVLRYSQAMLYQFFLEGLASEHSARMVAMKSAYDSAEDIISDMTLYYNKMRQNSITTELADSVSSRLGQE
jgi:F-type H+-transporting ATPase subunit gamma